jgi:hypothetical protein
MSPALYTPLKGFASSILTTVIYIPEHLSISLQRLLCYGRIAKQSRSSQKMDQFIDREKGIFAVLAG